MTSPPHYPAATSERRPGPGGPLLGAAGIVAVWAATLLPWARSGQVDRNLFSVGALAGRLGFLGSLPSGALAAIFLVTALPAVLVLLRLWRAAGVLAGLIGALAVATGVAALSAGQRGGTITVHPAGPTALVIAGLLLLAAAVITIRSMGRPWQSTAADTPSPSA